MSNKVWVVIGGGAVAGVFLLGSYLFVFQEGEGESTPQARQGEFVAQDQAEADVIVRITEEGFVPQDISTEQGKTIAWINETDDFRWPASDLHPTHRIYPELDPQEPVAPGEAWIFTAVKIGTWDIHDHLRPSDKGTLEIK